VVLDLIGVAITFLAVAVGAWFLAPYLVKVFQGQRVFLSPVLRPVERGTYWLMGVDETKEHSWVGYGLSVFMVTIASLLFTYLVLRLQDHLPFNPMGFGPVPADLAFNTAVSFTTNTNWQNYTGEQTMSYFSQMVGLVMHNFLSAATGIAMAVALVRGISSRQLKTLGNFYVDVTRATLYVLLPIAFVAALVLASASPPTPTGRTTRASRRCPTSPRWSASSCTTFSPPPRASLWRSPSCGGSPAGS